MSDEVDEEMARWRTIGWQASIRPCEGTRQHASAGVALLAPDGVAMCPLVAGNCPVKPPLSSRSGFWLCQGPFSGGHITCVLYLTDSIGLVGPNMTLLDRVMFFLRTLGKPFVILADWQVSPQTLRESNWVTNNGCLVVNSGRPSAVGHNYSSEIDYAVVSGHWESSCLTAQIDDAISFYPHSGVGITLPGKVAPVSIQVLKRPAVHPAPPAFGPPVRNPAQACVPQFVPPRVASATDLEPFVETFYQGVDLELAAHYGEDLHSSPQFGGRFRQAEMKKVRLVSTAPGPATTTWTAAAFRSLAARVREVIARRMAISAGQCSSPAQRRDFFALMRRLFSTHLPSSSPPYLVDMFCHVRKVGFLDCLLPQLEMLVQCLFFEALSEDERVTSIRARKAARWAQESSAGNASAFYRWMRDKPPWHILPRGNRLLQHRSMEQQQLQSYADLHRWDVLCTRVK